jgi:hypothetical protein
VLAHQCRVEARLSIDSLETLWHFIDLLAHAICSLRCSTLFGQRSCHKTCVSDHSAHDCDRATLLCDSRMSYFLEFSVFPSIAGARSYRPFARTRGDPRPRELRVIPLSMTFSLRDIAFWTARMICSLAPVPDMTPSIRQRI